MKTLFQNRNRVFAAGAILVAVGVALVVVLSVDSDEATGDGEREILYWVAPMDPGYRRDEPGKSPMGMDLVPVYADEVEEPGVVRVAPEVRAAMGVRTARVERGALSYPIDAFGQVEIDEARRSHVHLRTSGWIERLHVRTTGEHVEQGQALFEFYSPELVNAQEEFVQSLRTGTAGRINAGRERLRALGVSGEQIERLEQTREVRQTVTIRAHHGGGIVEALNVADGMRVTPEDMPMVLADLGEVWVIAEVFESQAARVAAGQPVEIRLPFRPGESIEGELDYVYPELNRTTRATRVRVRLANAHDLQPGMYASVRIQVPAGEDVLHIPREALIRTGRQERVVTVKEDGRFRVRPVRSGQEYGERVEILEGLEAGQVIVASGLFLIDSESSVTAETARLDAGGEVVHEHEETPDETPEQAQGEGRINRIDADERVINLDHDPIPALEWPAMTMDFAVAGGIDLSALAEDQRVRFSIRREDGKWRIVSIETVPGASGAEHEHDHGPSDEDNGNDGDHGHHHHH